MSFLAWTLFANVSGAHRAESELMAQVGRGRFTIVRSTSAHRASAHGLDLDDAAAG